MCNRGGVVAVIEAVNKIEGVFDEQDEFMLRTVQRPTTGRPLICDLKLVFESGGDESRGFGRSRVCLEATGHVLESLELFKVRIGILEKRLEF